MSYSGISSRNRTSKRNPGVANALVTLYYAISVIIIFPCADSRYNIFIVRGLLSVIVQTSHADKPTTFSVSKIALGKSIRAKGLVNVM